MILNRKLFIDKTLRTIIVHWLHFENNNPFGAEMILYAWLKSIHGTGWYSELNLEMLIEISDFNMLMKKFKGTISFSFFLFFGFGAAFPS